MDKKFNLKKYITIFVILIIPFFYVFFFLKAFWNPDEIALNGVKDRVYYSSITIPKDFSDNIMALQKK